MIDYKSIEIAKAIPEADSMIETFRAIGYNLESAIADIIDNSISAGAKNIRIQRMWRGGHSVLTIVDDGHGMNNNELINAMRPGAQKAQTWYISKIEHPKNSTYLLRLQYHIHIAYEFVLLGNHKLSECGGCLMPSFQTIPI